MRQFLGRTVQEALSLLPPGQDAPRILETAAPLRAGQEKKEGTLRVVACREGVWIAARFQNFGPSQKEEA